jgi:hypothetical protein
MPVAVVRMSSTSVSIVDASRSVGAPRISELGMKSTSEVLLSFFGEFWMSTGRALPARPFQDSIHGWRRGDEVEGAAEAVVRQAEVTLTALKCLYASALLLLLQHSTADRANLQIGDLRLRNVHRATTTHRQLYHLLYVIATAATRLGNVGGARCAVASTSRSKQVEHY